MPCLCRSGGILVFLTGQAEVHSVCRRLRKAFPFRKGNTTTGECNTHPLTLLTLICLSVFIYVNYFMFR